MYFGHGEPQGVSESDQTRIPGWSNPTVYSTDAMAFRCTWEHLGAPATCLGAPTTNPGALEYTRDMPGSDNNRNGSMSNHDRAVWETLLAERCWCAPENHSYYSSFNTF
jgi:hypothetical protein